MAFIAQRSSFNEEHLDAIIAAVEAVDAKEATKEGDEVDRLSQTMNDVHVSQASSGSVYAPPPGRDYVQKKADNLSDKVNSVRAIVELNVSSTAMAPILASFTGNIYDDRTLRRWTLATIELAQKHLEEVVSLDIPFGFAIDGSKIGPRKFETMVLLLPERKDFVFGMIEVENEKIETVRRMFLEQFNKLSQPLREIFARNCSYFMSDQAKVALGICDAVNTILQEVHQKTREKINCKLHSLMHMEKSLERSLPSVPSKINDVLRKILSSSRTHGLHASRGDEFSLFMKAIAKKANTILPTEALEPTLGVRFGGLNGNLAKIVVNFEWIIHFLRRNEIGEAATANLMEQNKKLIILEFSSIVMVWRHVCVKLWSSVSHECSFDDYRRTIAEFKTAVEAIKKAADPATFMASSELNSFAGEEAGLVVGFSEVVASLAAQDEDRQALNSLIVEKLDKVVKTFDHFERLPSEEIEVIFSQSYPS